MIPPLEWDRHPPHAEPLANAGVHPEHSQLLVVGHRVPDAGRQRDVSAALAEWKVLVLVQTADGLVQHCITPEQADVLADELRQMAAVCRTGFAALEQRKREQECSR